MPLKQAQDYIPGLQEFESSDYNDNLFNEFNENNDLIDNLEVEEDSGDILLADDEPEELDSEEIDGEIMLQVDDEEPITKEFQFTLPAVPGSESQEDIPELEVEEPEEDIKVEEENRWGWRLENFMNWLSGMMVGIPKHSGYEVVGIDRANSYLTRLKKEIYRAAQMDVDEVLDISVLEKAIDEIENGIERLEERRERILSNKNKGKKKKAYEEDGLVKEAQKAAGVQGRIVITVPLLISTIARVCINGFVSGGHDLETMYKKQVEEYNLTKREQAELLQLLTDMNFPIRRDRGIAPGESIDVSSSDNYDWSAQYYA